MTNDKPTTIERDDALSFVEGHTQAVYVRELRPGDRITGIGWSLDGSSWLVFKVRAIHERLGFLETVQGPSIHFAENAILHRLNDDVDAIEYMAQLALRALALLPEEAQLRIKQHLGTTGKP